MTDIEIRALLGDMRAQEECTRKGVLLPCPFCGSENIRTSNWGMWRCWCPECIAKSDDCLRERDAIKKWNTRHVPPIGRCRDCANKEKATVNAKGFLICPASGMEITDADFCSYFEPKWKELAQLQPLGGVGTKEEAKKNHVPGTAPERSNRNG